MKTKMKKYQDGGGKKKTTKKPSTSTPFQNYMKSTPGAQASDTTQSFSGSRNTDNPKLDKAYNETYYAGRENERRTGSDKVKYDSTGKRVRFKTGGMVNPNAKLQASKTAGSKGVKSGVNPKAAASKVAKGRSGGTSAAPKTAIPKAKYGMSIKKYQDGGATSKFGIKSYNFMDTEKGGGANVNSKQVEGAKYGEGNKRKYITLDADKGTMTKTKFNKNNEYSTKVKNIGTKRVTNKISKIASQKIGGAVKKK